MPTDPNATQLLARSWLSKDDEVKVRALFALLGRPKRFMEVARQTGVKHPNQATQALKTLTEEVLVTRRPLGKGEQAVEYEITARGIEVWNHWYFLQRLTTLPAAYGMDIEPATASNAEQSKTVMTDHKKSVTMETNA